MSDPSELREQLLQNREIFDMDRFCVICWRPITCCSAFVFAGDLLDCWNGTRKTTPRELCGFCDVVLRRPKKQTAQKEMIRRWE